MAGTVAMAASRSIIYASLWLAWVTVATEDQSDSKDGYSSIEGERVLQYLILGTGGFDLLLQN